MTSFAMIAGMVPLALGLGDGGEQTAPLGRAVVGGLTASMTAKLFVLPSVFTVIMGKSSTSSVSLDPDDPKSPHHDPERTDAQSA
jgi:Cu/Ag efflux pump CusA